MFRYWVVLFFALQWAVSRPLACAENMPKGLQQSGDEAGRVAVVIGNSRYPSGALPNPRNDATAVAASLKRLNFDVELKLDASKADLNAVFRRFAAKADNSGVALVFYAGHGIQVNGNNYLIPVDANPQSERDLKREMVRLDDVIDDMGNAKVKLVFFDACRDNPLARSFTRGASRGLAAPVEATGTLISFATKHGNTASDGEGKNSPYTTALIAALESPQRLEIEQMLRKVQQDVKRDTQGQQEPWRYGSLDGDFYFRAPEPLANQEAAQKEIVDRAVAAAVAEAVRKASELAARERAELEKKANEQAERERAEFQATMARMLNEALERQNALLQAEREARKAAGEVAVASVPVAVIPEKEAKNEPPLHLAKVAPSSSVGAKASSSAVQPMRPETDPLAERWEYAVKDEKFGANEHRILYRVKAVSDGKFLEEFSWDGGNATEWVLGKDLMAVAVPGESRFMLAPHWDGTALPSNLDVLSGRFPRCNVSAGNFCRVGSLKVVGQEKISVAAGVFDTTRVDGWVTVSNYSGGGSAPFTAWYSKELGRLIKQTVTANNRGWNCKETIELIASSTMPPK